MAAKGKFFWIFISERVKRFLNTDVLLKSGSCQVGVSLARF